MQMDIENSRIEVVEFDMDDNLKSPIDVKYANVKKTVGGVPYIEFTDDGDMYTLDHGLVGVGITIYRFDQEKDWNMCDKANIQIYEYYAEKVTKCVDETCELEDQYLFIDDDDIVSCDGCPNNKPALVMASFSGIGFKEPIPEMINTMRSELIDSTNCTGRKNDLCDNEDAKFIGKHHWKIGNYFCLANYLTVDGRETNLIRFNKVDELM